MPSDNTHSFTIENLGRTVPCFAVAPTNRQGALPLCLFLYGGGGGKQSLVDLCPTLQQLWNTGRIGEMIIATADVGPFGFYLDTKELERERIVSELLAPAVAEHCDVSPDRLALLGISMGGFGALRMAFANPHRFDVVAALQPMIEPGWANVPLRNRFAYPPELPSWLVRDRDPEVLEALHPISVLERHREEIVDRRLAIYLDAAGRDVLNAHDGAELLHRTLWDLDVSHEYHLWRDADHADDSLLARLEASLRWVAAKLHRDDTSTSPLREMLEPARVAAQSEDPSIARTYGVLPVRDVWKPEKSS